MPFSRSRSPESRTRSTTAWLERKAPVWRSIASTSVVLPWSTWATIGHVAQVGADGGGEARWPVFVVGASGTGSGISRVGWDGRLSHGCREGPGAQVLPRTLRA